MIYRPSLHKPTIPENFISSGYNIGYKLKIYTYNKFVIENGKVVHSGTQYQIQRNRNGKPFKQYNKSLWE